MATVAIVGTMDTKGVEYAFIKKCLEKAGVKTLVIDVGINGNPQLASDISTEQVVNAIGKRLSDIQFFREGSDTRAVAIQTVSDGLKVVLAKLLAEKKIDAVFGMGGSGGTNILSQAMQTMPLGVPKMIVSTMMSGNVKSYVGHSDMTMMYSVTDIAGLNQFSRLILANAAHAIAGMALNRGAAIEAAEAAKKPLIAISMFGITTPGVLRIRDNLEKQGFETIVFHATGSGGMAMESMISQGVIDGVIDYTLAELCSHEFGGILSAGPNRLTAASRAEIPQVVVPGAIEVLNFGAVETVPKHLNVPDRKLIIHNPTICAVKASNDEVKILGKIVADRLNTSTGYTAVALPLKGLDAYESEGGPWQDETSDNILFESIATHLKPEIPVHKLNNHINDKTFADYVSDLFCSIWKSYLQDQSKKN